MMIITILGLGCPTCRRLEADVRAVVQETGLQARLERVDDPATIARMGIFHLPQLAVDGRVQPFIYRNRRSVEQVLLAARAA